jgi:hypothetical protein
MVAGLPKEPIALYLKSAFAFGHGAKAKPSTTLSLSAKLVQQYSTDSNGLGVQMRFD